MRIDIFTPSAPILNAEMQLRHIALKVASTRWIEQDSAINAIHSNCRFADLIPACRSPKLRPLFLPRLSIMRKA